MSNKRKEDIALDDLSTGFSTDGTKHSTFTKASFYLAVGGVVILVFYCFIYAVTVQYHPHTVDPPQVVLPCGPVIGKWDVRMPSLAVFRGIPYAQPPIGTRRWRPPQPSYPGGCWQGTFNATANGNICYQYGAYTSAPGQSEDCLNLNVWTKTLPKPNGTDSFPPVVLFLHGGGNVYGSLGAYRDLDYLIRAGSICLVAPNYRLNAFGFLALSELAQSDSSGTSGNYGISDILLVLQWIQSNIVKFGCDATKVTVLGHGSGATNALALLATSSNNLFHRVIALSGSPNISMNLATAEQQNRQTFLANSPCANRSGNAVVTCLQNLTAQDVLRYIPPSWFTRSFWPTNPSGLNFPGLVIVDGTVVEVPLSEALRNADVDVPLFLQNTKDELELFYANMTISRFNATTYNQYLINNFLPFGTPNGTAGSQLVAQYANVTSISVNRSYYDLQTDIGIFCPNVDLGFMASQLVYVSVVAQAPSKPIPITPTTFAYDPFHFWDFILLTQSWNFFQSTGGSIFDAGSGSGNVAGYMPSDADLNLGNTLRSELFEFINTGMISALTPISSGSYSIAVQGTELSNSNVANVLNYRKSYCDLLKSTTVGLYPDNRFWWVN